MLKDVEACIRPALNPPLPLSPQAGWQTSRQPTSPTQTRWRRKKKTSEMTTPKLRIKMLATAAATPTACCWDSLLWVCIDWETQAISWYYSVCNCSSPACESWIVSIVKNIIKVKKQWLLEMFIISQIWAFGEHNLTSQTPHFLLIQFEVSFIVQKKNINTHNLRCTDSGSFSHETS